MRALPPHARRRVVLRSVEVPVIHYTIDDELHRRAKVAAAQLGISLKEFLERALDEKAAKVERRRK